jgi:hypothetical protein
MAVEDPTRADMYRQDAAAALEAAARASQPVQVEVTELRAWKDAAVVILEQVTVQGRPALDVIDTMTQHTRPAALGGGDHE